MNEHVSKEKMDSIMHSAKHGITVSIGYGWNGDKRNRKIGYEYLSDPFWLSLQEEFGGMCKRFAINNQCRIDLRRLRATYGHPILESVLAHVRHSQVLIFDLGAIKKTLRIPKKGRLKCKDVFHRLNYNVLFELGAAHAHDTPCLIMCPDHLRHELPSDISGYLISFYSGTFVDGKFIRKCSDRRGLQAAFRGMLKDAFERANDVNL